MHCHPQNAYLGSAVGIELTYFSKSSWSVKHNTDPRCVITVSRWLIYTSPPHFDNQSSINWCSRWFGLSVCDCCHRGDTCFRVFQPPFSNVSFTMAWFLAPVLFFPSFPILCFSHLGRVYYPFWFEQLISPHLNFRMFIFVFVFVCFGFFKSALTAYFVSVAAIFISFLFPSLLNK